MKRLNIRDIAQLAGVSRQTVSRVLNNDASVKASTREKVQKIIEEFGYIPNKSAQSHFRKYSMSVGLAIPDIDNPFYPPFIRGVLDEAEKANYNVFIYNIDPLYQKSIEKLKVAEEISVDGIITFISRTPPDDLVLYAKRHIPMVVVNRELTSRYLASVISDNYQGGCDAVEHLISQGKKRIGFIGPVKEIVTSRRYKAYKDTLEKFGHNIDKALTSDSLETEEGGYIGMKSLLAERKRVDAVFCYNDLMAIGAIDAIQEAGLDVPGDIAIVGYDDIELARRITPKITTVKIDKYQLGEVAFKQFMALRGNEIGILETAKIPTELIIRESS